MRLGKSKMVTGGPSEKIKIEDKKCVFNYR